MAMAVAVAAALVTVSDVENYSHHNSHSKLGAFIFEMQKFWD